MLSGISGMTPYASYGVYGAGYSSRALQPQGSDRAQSAQRPTELWTARKTAQPELPVQPVTQARPVGSQEDPVEMAVRMRIQYPNDPTRQAGAAQAAGADRAQIPEALGLKDAAGGQKEAAPALEDAKSAREVMEEGECQTCKERKYQDGSDDPGVSFKTPTNIAPEQAASAVRGHENEHVVRREDRKVVSQSVTYHTSICPECGKAYVSGGTTRTVTKAGESQQADQQSQQQDPRTPFSAVA